jgi:hypothetical protein
MDLNGDWYNELGSKMTLRVKGSSITGKYHTAVGDADGIYELGLRPYKGVPIKILPE